jgi:hypothetical protein
MNITTVDILTIIFLTAYLIAVFFILKNIKKYLKRKKRMQRTLKQRILITLPCAVSILSGCFLFILIYSFIGITPTISIMDVEPNSVAEKAGLKAGDKILKREDVIKSENEPAKIYVRYERDNSLHNTVIVLEDAEETHIGATLMKEEDQFSPINALFYGHYKIVQAFNKTIDVISGSQEKKIPFISFDRRQYMCIVLELLGICNIFLGYIILLPYTIFIRIKLRTLKNQEF